MMPGHRRALAGGDDSDELGGTDLVGLHEYAMGDDLRRLHWATSARTGTLMVREDAEPSEAHVCVLLDDRASGLPRRRRPFEEAVEIAAALCRSGVDAGSPVRLHTVQRPPRGAGARLGRAAVPRREHQDLDWLLAEIDLTGSLSRRRAARPRPRRRGRRHRPRGRPARARLALGDAPTRVLVVVDPAPLVGAHQEAGLLVLRGATSVSLAMLWDAAVAR